MTTIRVIDASGAMRDIASTGQTHLMQLLQDHGYVSGSCGGNLSCASCHVYVRNVLSDGTPEASKEECDLLEFSEQLRENSRLACQIPLSAVPEGCEIEIPTA